MARTLLSVNINKYALLRNSRGHNAPNLLEAADVCIAAGAHGITVHPRLDQRHVRFDDLTPLSEHLQKHHPNVELNIECEDHPAIVQQVIELLPAQCTLVPVTPGEVTSDHGWDLPREHDRLAPTIERLKSKGIRVSCFADPNPNDMAAFAAVGADRVELCTGPYAWAWGRDEERFETQRIIETAEAAAAVGLGLNAGHDLDRFNLAGMRDIDNLQEVSIGHAQICRALEIGTDASVKELLAALGW